MRNRKYIPQAVFPLEFLETHQMGICPIPVPREKSGEEKNVYSPHGCHAQNSAPVDRTPVAVVGPDFDSASYAAIFFTSTFPEVPCPPFLGGCGLPTVSMTPTQWILYRLVCRSPNTSDQAQRDFCETTCESIHLLEATTHWSAFSVGMVGFVLFVSRPFLPLRTDGSGIWACTIYLVSSTS